MTSQTEKILISQDRISLRTLISKLRRSLQESHADMIVQANIQTVGNETSRKKKSLLDMVGAAQGQKSFDTAEEADDFIRRERDRWEK